MKTEQETFDTVAIFLIKQGQRAVDSVGNCLYKTSLGLKCAAGCLIPDDKYSLLMDRNWQLANTPGLVMNTLIEEGYDPEFVRELQKIHDSSIDWNDWKNKMFEFANNCNLSTKVFE